MVADPPLSTSGAARRRPWSGVRRCAAAGRDGADGIRAEGLRPPRPDPRTRTGPPPDPARDLGGRQEPVRGCGTRSHRPHPQPPPWRARPQGNRSPTVRQSRIVFGVAITASQPHRHGQAGEAIQGKEGLYARPPIAMCGRLRRHPARDRGEQNDLLCAPQPDEHQESSGRAERRRCARP
jgi:hypothetical protein